MESKADSANSWPVALWIGVVLSVLWFVILAVYAVQIEIAAAVPQVSSASADVVSHWHKFWHNSPDAFGNALAGVFAPLAFLWLVVATFLQKDELVAQRRELAQSRQALELQADELKNSVAQLAAQTEIFTRTAKQDTDTITQQKIDRELDHFAKYCAVNFERVYATLHPPNAHPHHITLLRHSEHSNRSVREDRFDDILIWLAASLERFAGELNTNAPGYSMTRSDCLHVLSEALEKSGSIAVLLSQVPDSESASRATVVRFSSSHQLLQRIKEKIAIVPLG
jgi:hypothetical protein